MQGSKVEVYNSEMQHYTKFGSRSNQSNCEDVSRTSMGNAFNGCSYAIVHRRHEKQKKARYWILVKESTGKDTK